MRTRGAMLRQAPGKYEVVDLEVDDPRPGEVRVKMVASGLCHSDDHLATGDITVGTTRSRVATRAPASSARSAPNTKGFDEGDHVVFSFLPACGHCRWCATGTRTSATTAPRCWPVSRWADPTELPADLDGAAGRPDVRHLDVLRVHHGLDRTPR